MKILIAIYWIQDYGGMINHTEQLAAGLKELGHTVDFKMLVPSKELRPRTVEYVEKELYAVGGTGYPYHQKRGWKGVPKVACLDTHQRNKFIKDCGEYDFVIWQTPVPTQTKPFKGFSEWTEMYDNGTKNIAVIHDGNMPLLYPHLLLVQHKFCVAICVHESAFESARILAIPRMLVVNPHHIQPKELNGYADREGFAAVQIFKGWKRVDSLIRAIPYMDNRESKIVGGAGIEYRYMTSKDKCKDKYFNKNGDRIWDVALNSGMLYKGVMLNEKVLELMGNVKLQIDPSFSAKYAKHGAHFNRTTVEAMIHGAVPVATDLGMCNSGIFHKDVNYIEIPHTSTPVEFADIIDEALQNKDRWEFIQNNNNTLTSNFDRCVVAERYVNLATNKDDCIYQCNFGSSKQEHRQAAHKRAEYFN